MNGCRTLLMGFFSMINSNGSIFYFAILDSPSIHLNYLHIVPIPADNRVAQDVEELAPQLQVSRGIREALTSNLTDDLRS